MLLLIDYKSLPLPIKGVHFTLLVIIKALVWEIPLGVTEGQEDYWGC
jgi:hypothetical protein